MSVAVAGRDYTEGSARKWSGTCANRPRPCSRTSLPEALEMSDRRTVLVALHVAVALLVGCTIDSYSNAGKEACMEKPGYVWLEPTHMDKAGTEVYGCLKADDRSTPAIIRAAR